MKSSIIKPPFWVMPDANHYSKWIYDTFSYDDDAVIRDATMFPHQRFVRDFMQEKSPNRGLLLYHGLGVGKTRSAIAIAETSVQRDIVVMLPASLHVNFESEVAKIKGKKNYTYVHYDGLNSARVKQLEAFDNKLVIIDEVHTFISRVIGPDNKVARETYQKMMEGENCKVIALTGTPIINTPFELACTLNLIQGYMYYTTYLPAKGSVWSEAEYEVTKLKHVHKVVPVLGGFSVYFLPMNFERASSEENDGKIVFKSRSSSVDSVMKILEKHNIRLASEPKIEKTSLFPIFKDQFTDLYVDYPNQVVLKQDDFSTKVQGLVSYFESYDSRSYPVQNPIEYVHIPMKKIQFGKYIMVRQKEVEKEFKARANNDDVKGGGNVYRAFSRAMCNFVFPDEIKRPYPSTMKQFKQEVDDFEEDLSESVKEKSVATANKAYDVAVAQALKQLEANADQFLSPSALAEHGPKYNAILERLDACPGSALVYSSFRNVEGIKIMSLVLNHNGYAELKVRKDAKTKEWKLSCSDFDAAAKYIVFTKNKDENQILMNLFNSDIDALPTSIKEQLEDLNNGKLKSKASKTSKTSKTSKASKASNGTLLNLHGNVIKVLMITQSGAQGISLKNVRQVHIMEPFWNNIRVMQVRGRAIRAMSHIALPVKERVVDTYMYVMALEAKEQKDHPLIKANDAGMSSDGYILDIAKRKSVINDQFLQLVKNSSVDCTLNKSKHGTKVKCYTKKSSKRVVKPIFKSFIIKSMNRNFMYLANPTDAEKAEFSAGRQGVGWTGLYSPADKTLIGAVRIDENGTPKNISMES